MSTFDAVLLLERGDHVGVDVVGIVVDLERTLLRFETVLDRVALLRIVVVPAARLQ
jgi:hypothetical protein